MLIKKACNRHSVACGCQLDLSKFVLLLDNLKGQIQDDFKQSLSSINSPLLYGLPDATDLC